MQNNSGLLKLFGFIATAVLLGVGIGWLASRPKTASVPISRASGSTAHAGTAHALKGGKLPDEKTTTANPAEAPTPLAIVLPETQTAPDWSDKVGDILTADTEIPQKCTDMLNLFPTVPDEGKVEIVGHLNNLIADADYAPLGKILIDPKTPAAASREVLIDLFNRANSLKIPLMLQVARTPGHPLAESAREDLTLLMEEDHGTDWAQWEKSAEKWLQENPD